MGKVVVKIKFCLNFFFYIFKLLYHGMTYVILLKIEIYLLTNEIPKLRNNTIVIGIYFELRTNVTVGFPQNLF